MGCLGRRYRTWALLLVLLPLGVLGADLPDKVANLGWVGLYNQELLEWLENENRLSEICPASLPADTRRRCNEQSLKPKSVTLSVYKRPNHGSPKIGTLEIKAAPGKGLSISFGQLPFVPDLYDPDWGYGPYFHQTFMARQGSWFLLPKEPLAEAGWVDSSQMSQRPDALVVALVTVYEFGGSSVVITDISPDAVVVRPEQPADMWCEEGEPPPLKLDTLRRVTLADLVDENGHLKLKIKYTRGC